MICDVAIIIYCIAKHVGRDWLFYSSVITPTRLIKQISSLISHCTEPALSDFMKSVGTEVVHNSDFDYQNILQVPNIHPTNPVFF